MLFAGDALMPYLGQPFTDEGSPEGLLEALAFIDGLRPRLLIHGHPPLTDLLTAAAVPGLEAALTRLRGEVLDAIRRGLALPTSSRRPASRTSSASTRRRSSPTW